MIENKAILIDTCIVRNLLSKEKPLREETEYFLSELRKSTNPTLPPLTTNLQILPLQ